MHMLHRNIIAFAIVLSLFVPAFAGSEDISQTLRLTNGEWAPYMSQKLKYYGIASRIVTDVFAEKGIKVEYGFFPWARAYYLAKIGKYDGAVGYSKTDERLQYFIFSRPMFKTTTVFFHLKSFDFDWKSYDDLRDLVIGASLEYNYGSDFLKAQQEGKIEVDYTYSDELNFQKLLHKRIQVFVCEIEVGYNLLRVMYDIPTARLFTNHPKSVDATTQHLMLNKDKPASARLIRVFDEGLIPFEKAGKIDLYIKEARQGKYSDDKH